MANEQQIVVAADVTDQANDVRQTVPMVNQTIDNLDAAGVAEKVRARRILTAEGDHRTGVRPDQGRPWVSQFPSAKP